MLLNYDVIIVEKVPFSVLAYLKWRTFSSTCSTSPIFMKFYQQVRSMERSKVAKFQDDIISINRVMTSKIIWHDIIKNVGIPLKLCRLSDLAVVIICANLCWFKEITSSTDVVYLLSMTSLTLLSTELQTTWSPKFFSAKWERLILLPVKFQIHIISRSTNFYV